MPGGGQLRGRDGVLTKTNLHHQIIVCGCGQGSVPEGEVFLETEIIQVDVSAFASTEHREGFGILVGLSGFAQ